MQSSAEKRTEIMDPNSERILIGPNEKKSIRNEKQSISEKLIEKKMIRK